MTSSRATTICIIWIRTGGSGTITGRALTSEHASDSANGGTSSPLIPRTRRSRWILSCRWCVRSSPASLATSSSRAKAESLLQPNRQPVAGLEYVPHMDRKGFKSRSPLPAVIAALALIVVEVDLVLQRSRVLGPHDVHGL